MSARARLTRAASAVLVGLLVIGASALGGGAAYAVTDEGSTTSQVETEPQATDAEASAAAVEDEADAATEEQAAADVPADEPASGGAASDPEAGVSEIAPAETQDSAPARAEAKNVAAEADTAIDVTNATLEWGVKSSFRNYIYNTQPQISKGKATLLGTTQQPVEQGEYVWSGGVGTADDTGASADVSFGTGNGVHFQSHPMETDGEEVYALDMRFTNPRVVVTSESVGQLRMDAVGYKYKSATEVGERYELEDAPIADLELSAPEIVGTVMTWTDAKATLTEEGAVAFGETYKPGDELDPVTFSTDKETEQVPGGPVSTRITLSASQTDLIAGETLTLTASVTPTDAVGTVSFSDAEGTVGSAAVKSGKASLTLNDLAVDDYAFTAAFEPADADAYEGSTSKAVKVQVQSASSVTGTQLSWGVKASFRNYIYSFTAFKGKSSLLGNAKQPKEKGVFVWNDGTGEIEVGGTKGEAEFGTGDGVHFQSHPMTVNGKELYALDMQFMHPRIVITSATTAELRMDVSGREFIDMSTVGPEYRYDDAVIAKLTLPTPTASGRTYTWTNAVATLTKQGAQAFGAFYSAGESLDPVTFSILSDHTAVVKKQTKTSLSASKSKVTKGKSVAFTAKTSPAKLAGTVTFSSGGKKLGTSTVKQGKATFSTKKLGVGIHSVVATFTPKNADYGHSNSSAVKVTVTQKQMSSSGGSGGTSGTGATEGSLSWGISEAFAAYTTCDNKEAFGYSHCAKGSISTSGVGAGYLFPQSGSSSWNKKSQTGTVRYSGSVSFKGYGMTMFSVSNPSITVHDGSSATLKTGNSTSFGSGSYRLDLSSATKTVGKNGVVTWSNVPVAGTLSSGGAGGSGSQMIGLDSLSFTVGAESSVTYGSTNKDSDDESEYEAAATAPTTSGITVLTAAEKITAGGRISLQAAGFDPDDEGVLVVLYDADGTNPVVLDDSATATSVGAVSWSGTLPDDIEGDRVITLQGSTDAGAVITVLDKKTAKAAKNAGQADQQALSARLAAEQAQSAGLFGGAGMSLAEWWASAGGLVLIAGCTTLLAVRQRRAAA